MYKPSATVRTVCVLSVLFASAWAWHVSPYLFFAVVYLYIGDMLKDYIHWSMDNHWIIRFSVHLFWPLWLIAFIVITLYRNVRQSWKPQQ